MPFLPKPRNRRDEWIPFFGKFLNLLRPCLVKIDRCWIKKGRRREARGGLKTTVTGRVEQGNFAQEKFWL